MDSTQLIPLLREVKKIDDFYELKAKESGDNFNIFKILELESSEVRLHSRFLAELLNSFGR
ncbi:hypothetical protein ACVW0P_001224 [Mucilaginibacter sp. UYNi724]